MTNQVIRWYVIADGGRARIFSGDVRDGHLEPVAAMESRWRHSSAHESGDAPPGRVRESVGGARHSVEAADFAARNDHEFAGLLAEELQMAIEQHAFHRLILVAPTRFLATLQRLLTAQVAERVEATLPKDLCGLGTSEL